MRRAGPLLAALLVSCALLPAVRSSREPALSASGVDYFPITVGRWWLYDVEDYTFGWSLHRRVEVTRTGRVPGIGHDLTIIEETYTGADEPVLRAPVQPMGFYWAEGYLHALYLTEQGGELRAFEAMQAMRILPESLQPSMSWLDGASAPSALRFHVDRKHDLHVETKEIRVGERSWATIRVDTTEIHRGSAPRRAVRDVRYYYSDWYAAGVGLVRSETWDDAARTRLRVRIELLELGAAPPAAR